MDQHRLPVRAYFEDTDAMGVVYHANYLKFFERARTELLESSGRGVAELNRDGLNFAVYEVRVRFRRPARLGDRLEVVSEARLATPYRITFAQALERDGELLCKATVEVVCMSGSGALLRIPPEIARRLD